MPQASEYILSSLTVLSIAVILVEYFYPLKETQLTSPYVFDASVVAALATDLANRTRRGGRKIPHQKQIRCRRPTQRDLLQGLGG
ncbi:MAG: hypothetical protein RQ862_00335 [Candidatus Caldarchaeales archaeon]|jgi:hypothetical protein|nr:hypothetical protein [Candidatus Caldarchaeales archaeon]